MALRAKVLRTKAEKFERKQLQNFKPNPEKVSALDLMLQDVYVACRPKPIDYKARKDLVWVFNEIAKEIYGDSKDVPVVEEFGSFSMDLFSTRSDLDLSVNFTSNGVQITREKKIQTLRKFAKKFYALQSKGHVTGVHPITTAKVPILKVVDRGTSVECDLSVENRDGILKSQLIHMICTIDERFRKLSFLLKAWAKAQNINSSKDGTLNSLSIILLVAFHLQTRKPAILPPFTALFKDGSDLASVLKLLSDFENYGRSNKESVAELFVSLLIKLSSIERLWPKGLCVCVYDGCWTSKTWDSKVAHISVEDFTDRSQNVSRAVGAVEMKRICKCIQHSLRYVVAFMDGHMEGSKLLELLFGRYPMLPLSGAGSAKFNMEASQPRITCQPIQTNRLGQVHGTPCAGAINAQDNANVAKPYFTPCVSQTLGAHSRNGWEEGQNGMASNSILTKRMSSVDGWGGMPSGSWQQREHDMPLDTILAKKMRYNGNWTGIPNGSWGGPPLANLMGGAAKAQQPVNNWGVMRVDGYATTRQPAGGGWSGTEQNFGWAATQQPAGGGWSGTEQNFLKSYGIKRDESCKNFGRNT